MTSRSVLSGVKTYLQGAGLTLDGLVVATVDESIDKTYPLIIVSENGTSEHEVLRGIYEVSTVVTIHNDPERTTDAEHVTAVGELYAALGNITRMMVELNTTPNLQVWDVRDINQSTEPDSGRRSTSFAMTITASQT